MVDPAGYSPPYDFALTEALEERGADVRLLMPSAVSESWRNPNGKPRTGNNALSRAVAKSAAYVDYLAGVADTRRALDAFAPDIVHYQWLPLPVIDLTAIKAAGRASGLVYTMHNAGSTHEPTTGVRGWRRRAGFRTFERVIVHSEYSKTAAANSAVVEPEVLRVVPHGVLDRYRQLAPPDKNERTKVRLLFFGSIKPYKGLDILIDSLPLIRARTQSHSWSLTVAGKPSMPIAELQSKVDSMGLGDKVTWLLRHQTEREIAELLASCDCVVLPYRSIDQSGVLLAALGMCRPVVATRVGAFPEIIENRRHGLLVDAESVSQLADAMVEMIENTSLRSSCEREIEQLADGPLSWASIATRTMGIYEELLQSGARGDAGFLRTRQR